MNQIICSGGIFLSKKTKRFLFLLRAQSKSAKTWGLAGGKKDPIDVTPLDTLTREINEEIGFLPSIEKIVPIELYSTADNTFSYQTYILIVKDEFIPKLNCEHSGYAWVENENWPKPLHNGLKNTLNNKITKIKIETILTVIN
jgi:8-oxo-dGTP pyrophosphatase MutT (NUDIX family)